ncbi:unnamed protein product [Ambrosiozyma monospora]|uniref:precorrin-2 dehydrogenase n=1 Tax=Ambrosiozyma monospora TaxID=43982 RepID=A0A9W7DHB7_AMBMO|nr:unnamed protein product [Ambrosiozyma monospora]
MTTPDLDNLEIPQPNGSLMLAWQVKDRHVLVVGGGDVAISRVNHLLQANAKITIIAKDIDPVLHKYNELGLIYHLEERPFKPTDLTMHEHPKSRTKLLAYQQSLAISNTAILDETFISLVERFDKTEKFAMVLTAMNDYPTSLSIYHRCKLLQLNVNLADKPAQCDFYFGSVYRHGSLQLMISTNGKSPRFANRLKTQILIPALVPLDVDNAVACLGHLRRQLKEVVCAGSDADTIKERMKWNKAVTDFYSVEEWCRMDQEKVNELLKLYPKLPTKK